ncbi:MAG: hypothetical protein WC184_13205 [Acidimicrobiia bacterium]
METLNSGTLHDEHSAGLVGELGQVLADLVLLSDKLVVAAQNTGLVRKYEDVVQVCAGIVALQSDASRLLAAHSKLVPH